MTSQGKGHLYVYGNAAAAVRKNLQCYCVQWLYCSKLITKKTPEETKKMVGSPIDCATPAVRRIPFSDEGTPSQSHILRQSQSQQFQYLLDAVSPIISHNDSNARHNTTCKAPCCNSSIFSDRCITYNYDVHVMLTIFNDLIALFDLASTITVYGTRICWICTLYTEKYQIYHQASIRMSFIRKYITSYP